MDNSAREIEINIISLFFYLAKRWRSILAVAFATVILFLPFGIRKIRNLINETNNLPTAEEVSASTDAVDENNEGSDAIEPSILMPVDINSANNCYASIKNYQDLKAYYSNTPYMLIDVNATPHSTAIIDITAEEGSDIANITNLYQKLIEDISYHEYANNYTGNSIYSWDYLVSFEGQVDGNNRRSIIKLSFLYPEKEICTQLMESAIEFIHSSKDSISELYGEYTITVISETTEIIYSKYIEDIQNNSISLLDQTCTGIIQQIQEFNKPQLEYLSELMKSDPLSDTDIAKIISDTIDIKEIQIEAQLAQGSAEDTASLTGDGSEENLPVNTGITKTELIKMLMKNLILGLFCGLFLSVCFHSLNFIMTNRLDYADNLTELFGITHFGNIIRNRAFKSPIDKLINKLQHMQKKLDENNDIDLCATDISLSLENKNDFKSAIITCKSEFENSDLLNKLSAKLSEHGKSTTIIQNVLEHSNSFNSMTNLDGVIIAGMSEKTLRNDIYRLKEILKRHNIAIIGGIIIE